MPNYWSATYSQSTGNHSDYSVLISSMEQHCAAVFLLVVQGSESARDSSDGKNNGSECTISGLAPPQGRAMIVPTEGQTWVGHPRYWYRSCQ